MKIYVLDKGVYGSIVVTAKTREEAVKIIKAEDEFIKEERIEEYELEGFIHHNQGDQ